MAQLIKNATDVTLLLPTWKGAVPAIADHVSNLKIPTVHGGWPSLLLHDLGRKSSAADVERFERIPEIFSFTRNTYVRPLPAFFTLI